MSSAIYSARYGIKTMVADIVSGGALATSPKVDNFPGFVSTSGKEIMDTIVVQAKESGASILPENIQSITKDGDYFYVISNLWKEFKTKKVLLATWSSYNELGVTGEEEFLWKWVSYCATCDWLFHKGKEVVVVWGWNTALTEALYLSDICNKVTIVHRWGEFSADEILIEQVKNNKNIEFVFNEEVSQISWEEENWVSRVYLKSWKNINIEWVFIAIWSTPNTDLVNHFDLEKDEKWYLAVDERQETSLEWLYAAWDITDASNWIKQAITSASEWVIAAVSVHNDLMMERVSSYEKIREDSLEKEEGSKEKIEEKVIWYKDIEDKEDFNKFINSWKKVSVTFSASWCPPCKILKSQLKESTKEWLSVVMDDDWKKCKDFSGRKIKSFPTTFIFENWKIIDTITWADYNWIINKILY